MVMNQSSLYKEWFSNVPILWKRKIKKYAALKQQEAIKTFVHLYSQHQFIKHSEFGLSILLPDSLYFILSSLPNLEEIPRIRLLHLLDKKEFKEEILRLDRKRQEQLLLSIIEVWHNHELEKDRIRSILLNFQPELIETLYSILFKKKENNKQKTIAEILITWGKPIFPRLFVLYLSKPHDEIKKQIRNLNSKDRVSSFQKIGIVENFDLELLLDLFSTSKDELTYLASLTQELSVKNRKILNTWFAEKVLPVKVLEVDFPQQERNNFLQGYFEEITKNKTFSYSECLKLLITQREFPLADELIKKWEKKINIQGVLIDILIELNITDNSGLSFFQSKFATIPKKNLPKVIRYYLTATDSPLLNIFLPSIQNLAVDDWKTILKVASTFSTDIISDRLTNVLSESSSQKKNAIGTFIVTNKLISHYLFLLEEFDIFKPILLSKKPFDLKELVQIDPYLKNHIQTHIKEIALLGKKITYPIDRIADHFNNENLNTLVELVISDKRLLTFWEPAFIDHYEESLKICLDFIIKSSITEQYLQQLTETLINVDLQNFWDYFANTPGKSFNKLSEILKYAFQQSIKTLGMIIPNLSVQHNAYIIRNVLPEFSSKFSDILYSLFVFSPEEQNFTSRTKYIQELIRLDPMILELTLIRCNKILPMKKEFITSLIEPNLNRHPVIIFHTINTNQLGNLVEFIFKYINSLAISDLKDFLHQVIPSLDSEFLIKDLLQLLTGSFPVEANLSNLLSLLDEFERKGEYSASGKVFIKRYLIGLSGRSTKIDLEIFTHFQNKTRVQSSFLNSFIENIPQKTITMIINDPDIVISERTIAKALINELEARYVEKDERYFFKLYQNITKDTIKRAIIPKLGKYCTWNNLKTLMLLPDQNTYREEYQTALNNFATRFNLQSSQALVQIWESGLKDVYGGKTSKNSLKQTECPNCGKPILEKQLNCGFCIQKLTCAICRQSVVKFDPSVDIVRCPNCSSFFHRQHLLDALQVKKTCPVCNAPLSYQKVTTLPKYIFGFY
ncbi:MAG: hypothetical protein ACTSPG_03130 [Candidatus Hodarchaeales archaeon]